ncbi:MAG: flagellar hook-length control protein FliK [Rhodospirillaceae bacterium]|nr:flagellar hook-length control protein FliK [Rhodospirillaceae bacterium]
MDAIQALSSKANPAAPGAVANDDDSAAGAFAALLGRVSASVKALDTNTALDSKLVRGDEDAKARASADRDAAAKARNDKDDDRATAAKPKTNQSRDEDEESDQTKAASADETADDTADTTQTPEGQAAAQVAAAVAIDMPLVTTETIAPILLAQQVQAAADTGAVKQTAVQTVAAVTDTAAVETNTTAVDPNAGPKAAVVEAPAAVQKAADVTGPTFKQAVAETAGPVQAKATEQVAAAQTVTTDGETAKTTETAQATTTTQKPTSAQAQAQSQDLSQKVGPETKAQVQVTVTTHAAAHAATTNNVYDIYAGYNGTQASTANGQVGVNDAGNALVGSKNPAEAVQAQVASPASPALAPQPQTQASQQGTSSAMRADLAAPSATQGNGNHGAASFGDSAFGNTGSSNNQTNATTAGAQTTATESPQRTAQQIIDQIKVNITRAAKAGLSNVTIQLKPIELGRIDVKLEMSEDHKVRVTVTADNKDTLALLQNDSRTLERTLNDAGLRTDANNLHFSLRSDSDAQNAGDGKNGGANAKADDSGATTEEDDIAMTYDYTAAARARGGVDTFA